MSWRRVHCFKEKSGKIKVKLIHQFDSEGIVLEYRERKGHELNAMVGCRNGHNSLPPRGKMCADLVGFALASRMWQNQHHVSSELCLERPGMLPVAAPAMQ